MTLITIVGGLPRVNVDFGMGRRGGEEEGGPVRVQFSGMLRVGLGLRNLRFVGREGKGPSMLAPPRDDAGKGK